MSMACKHPDYRHLLCAGVLLSFLNGAACAEELSTFSYPEIVVDDVGHVITAPARWQEQE